MPGKLLAIALLLLAALTATPAYADDAACNTAKPEQLTTNTNDIQIVIQTKPPIYRDPVTGRTSLTAIGCLRVLTPPSGAGFYTGQIVAGFFDTNGHFLANGGQPLLNPSNQALQTVPTPTPTDPNWHEFGLTAYLDDPLDLDRIDPRALFEVTIQECAGPSAEASCLDRRHVFLWDTTTLTPTPPTTAQTHPPGHIDTPRVRRCIGFKDSDDGPRIAGANMTLIDNPLENTVTISLSGCIRFNNALDQANFGAGSVGAFFYGTDGTVLTSAGGPSTQAPGQAAPIFAAANIKVLPDPSHLTNPVPPNDPPHPDELKFGIHFFGFQYSFPNRTAAAVLPQATVVVKATGCSKNDTQTCTGPTPPASVQAIWPCVNIWPKKMPAKTHGCPSSTIP